jgi:hypothetical protein
MTLSAYSELSAEELISLYIDAATNHALESESGDPEAANKNYQVITEVYGELRSRSAEHAMLPLLSHENMSVRGWAATHALEFAPEAGETQLQTIAQGRGIAAFDARMTLREWHAGRLRFPPRRH